VCPDMTCSALEEQPTARAARSTWPPRRPAAAPGATRLISAYRARVPSQEPSDALRSQFPGLSVFRESARTHEGERHQAFQEAA